MLEGGKEGGRGEGGGRRGREGNGGLLSQEALPPVALTRILELQLPRQLLFGANGNFSCSLPPGALVGAFTPAQRGTVTLRTGKGAPARGCGPREALGGLGPPTPAPWTVSAEQTNPRSHLLDRPGGRRGQEALVGPWRVWHLWGAVAGTMVWVCCGQGPSQSAPEAPTEAEGPWGRRGVVPSRDLRSGALRRRDNGGILATSPSPTVPVIHQGCWPVRPRTLRACP